MVRPVLTSSRLVPALLVFAAFGTACETPVAISTASPRAIHRYLTRSALATDEPSSSSEIELRRYDLLHVWHDDPDKALERLHALALEQGLPAEALFALAELSFLRAEKTHDPGRFGASAMYAWAFLFPEEPRDPLDPLDPRSRVAADLYNRALASSFKRGDDGAIAIREGGLPLPFGHFTPQLGPLPDLGGYQIKRLDSVAELVVVGLRNRYRRPGVGAPLAATLTPTPESDAQPVPVAPATHVPLTALARVDAPLAQIRSGQLTGRIDVFQTLEVDSVDIRGQEIALEAEPTAALAAGLSESRFWQQELKGFFGDLLGVRGTSRIAALRPYRAGRIPAVFVHGTASSPGRWADMVNDLVADNRLRHRYAFWFFSYDSGNPIIYSGSQLRDALTNAVARADPSGTDPCLRDMVVMGHSQGGLLTKLTVVDAQDHFWRNITDTPIDQTSLSAETKARVRHIMFPTPLPFVRRVIFMATPHRGSYLAGPQIVRRLAQRLVRLPSDLAKSGADLATLGPQASAVAGHLPTSIDNMSPGHQFIKAIASLPVAPGVSAHSIIAVDSDAPLDRAGDGVVKYASAHIEPVESELIVHSPHSGMQAEPATVEEVRRILLEHSASSKCPATPLAKPKEKPEAPFGEKGPALPKPKR